MNMDVRCRYADSSLACFLRRRIEEHMPIGSDKVVAAKMGFHNTKSLHAIMSGEARLQLDRVLPLAHAIDVDVGWLFRMAASSYSPFLVELVDALLASADVPVTINELDILGAVRAASKQLDPKLTSDLEFGLASLFSGINQP